MSHEEGMAKAKESLDRALAHNPDLGEVHAFLGFWLRNELKWEEAQAEFRRALELSPSSALAHNRYASVLRSVGKLDEALSEARKAWELDPVDPGTGFRIGQVLYYRREYDKAIEQYKQVLRLQPNYSDAMLWMGCAYLENEMDDEALNAALKWKEQVGDYPSAPGFTSAMVAWFLASIGRKEEGKRMWEDAVAQGGGGEPWFPTFWAYWYVAMGDIDLAFKFLEKAYEARDSSLYEIRVDPYFDPIRSDQRYMFPCRSFTCRDALAADRLSAIEEFRSPSIFSKTAYA